MIRARVRPALTTALIPIGVLALAALLRFWALARPDELVFDELYYVRDALTQWTYGYPTEWPDDDHALGADRTGIFSDDASYVAHPPLGKWLIGLGMLVFGADNGWGWRSATALAGVLTVAVTMSLAWRLTRRAWVANVAGLLLAVDGVHVTLSRVSILDGYLTLFITLGALAVWLDHEWSRRNAPPPWFVRPWIAVAGACFGLAAGVKWSGLYALAAFAAFTVVSDFVRERSWPARCVRAVVTGVTATVTAVAAYLATWLGWILTDGGWDRDQTPWPATLARMHVDLFHWHRTLEDDHAFASHPATWPLALRPTGMFLEDLGGGWVMAISPLPNIIVTWGGALALLAIVWALSDAAVRRRWQDFSQPALLAGAFVLTGYLSGIVPWLLTPTRTSVFQFYAVVLTPFAAIALALLLAVVSDRLVLASVLLDRSSRAGRRNTVAVVLVMAVVIGVLFWPLWAGIPIPEWFRDAHQWLPGWR